MITLTTLLRTLQIQNTFAIPIYVVQSKGYAVLGLGKKKFGKAPPAVQKKRLPVETDVNKLVNYACGTDIYKEGEPVRLKPDSEYPDWLWTLNIGPKIPIEELDPNTLQYWRRVRREAIKRNNRLIKLEKLKQ